MLHRTASFRCAASRLLTTSRSQSAAAGSLSVLAGHSRCSAISANASAASAATGDTWNVSSCATGRRWFSSVPAELSDILTRELAEEESNASATMPDDLSELKSQIEEGGWRIVDGSSGLDAGSGSTIKLFKKDPLEGSGAKVAVAFHCQDTIPTEEEEEGGGFFGEDDGDEEEEDAVAARFTVLVSRAGRTMVYTCISEEATVNVERVCMVNGDDIESLINDGIDEKSYQGPEFSELAEDLQQSLGSYVDEVCGVDSDVAAFVSMYADYKEQCEYVAWLKSVKSML